MSKSKLSFFVQSTGPDLYLTVRLDDKIIYNKSPEEDLEKITWSFNDTDESEHLLCFEMSGKCAEHTKISESGEILQDRLIKITDVAFDDIILGQMFNELAEYHHDFNGYGDPTVGKFYGEMGCNGRVELKFTTPIYIWILENM